MKDFSFKNIDPEDIDDVLVKVEDSFDINFAENELAQILTFGELCDHIKGKIQIKHTDNCTSQQAFYKLQNALSTTLKVDKKNITSETLLEDLLPRRLRRLVVKQVEEKLGFKLSILRPPHFITIILMVLILSSLFGLGYSRWLGLIGLVLSFVGFSIANLTGNELDLKTVGQLTKKMTREHYIESRRDQSTFNENEIEKVLTDMFSIDLGLDSSKMTREVKV